MRVREDVYREGVGHGEMRRNGWVREWVEGRFRLHGGERNE